MYGGHSHTWAFMQGLAEEFDAVPTFARNVEWPAIIALLAHACSLLGAADHARTLAAVLASASAPIVRVGPMAGWWGPVDHHLGALCRVLGRSDEAVTRLERALEIDYRMRARPFEARTQLELALALRQRDAPEDRVRADDLETAARATADELGASALAVPYLAGG